jgi:hypothetical protein
MYTRNEAQNQTQNQTQNQMQNQIQKTRNSISTDEARSRASTELCPLAHVTCYDKDQLATERMCEGRHVFGVKPGAAQCRPS